MEIVGVGVRLEIAVTGSIFELSVKGFGIKWIRAVLCDQEINKKTFLPGGVPFATHLWYQLMTLTPSASESDRYPGKSLLTLVHSKGGILRTGGRWY